MSSCIFTAQGSYQCGSAGGDPTASMFMISANFDPPVDASGTAATCDGYDTLLQGTVASGAAPVTAETFVQRVKPAMHLVAFTPHK